MGLAGNTLIVWGAVFADRFFFEPLTQIYLGPKQGGSSSISGLDEAIFEVAKVLKVLQDGLAGLQKHYDGLPVPSRTPSSGAIRTSTSSSRLSPLAGRPSTDASAGGSSTGQKRTSAGASAGGSNTGPKCTSAGAKQASSGASHPSSGANIPGSAGGRLVPGAWPRWRNFSVKESGVTTSYTIEYERRLTTFFDKPVYLANMLSASTENKSTPAPIKVVVKFTPSYNKYAHQLLYAHGLAPKLYFADYVGTKEDDGPGMFVVVMEYIGGAVVDLKDASVGHREKLVKAVNTLHANNYVIGDLREPNILLRGGDAFYLIDYDWCGKEGQARYPASIRKDIDWAPGVDRNCLITTQHDKIRMIDLYLKMGGVPIIPGKGK